MPGLRRAGHAGSPRPPSPRPAPVGVELPAGTAGSDRTVRRTGVRMDQVVEMTAAPPVVRRQSDDPAIHARRWWILAVLCLALLIVGIDGTIVNVALPSFVRELGATTSQLQWISDAYTLAFAS